MDHRGPSRILTLLKTVIRNRVSLAILIFGVLYLWGWAVYALLDVILQ